MKQLEPRSFPALQPTTIEDFSEYFGERFSDEEFDTGNGLVCRPSVTCLSTSETVELGALRFEVLNADSRRLRLLRVDTPEAIAPQPQK